MIDTASKKVQINQIIRNQLPSFVTEESPLFIEFLSEYYKSQEFQGAPIDIISNFNDYQKAETFSGDYSLVGFTTSVGVTRSYDTTINVESTAGWPSKYGLLKIDDEIVTYTGITTNSFPGCIRGFSGVESLHKSNQPETLVFSESEAGQHISSSRVTNLSNLFLQEFWKKTKTQFLRIRLSRLLAQPYRAGCDTSQHDHTLEISQDVRISGEAVQAVDLLAKSWTPH